LPKQLAKPPDLPLLPLESFSELLVEAHDSLLVLESQSFLQLRDVEAQGGAEIP
jgi:hypothetical protein